MIEVKNLTKRYGNHLAVDHLNFTVESGKIYVGQVGDRLDLVVIFKKRSTYDIPSYAGWGTDTVGINVFRDDAGNCFIWKSTSAFFNITEGSKVRLRGTVKEHSDYKGTKQTILQRCKVDGSIRSCIRQHLRKQG